MEKKEEPEFTVTDRRKFTLEGELRPDVPQETKEEEAAPAQPPPSAAAAPPPEAPPPPKQERPPLAGPSAAERTQGQEAYKKSAAGLEGELGSQSGEFKPDFEHVLEPFYVTALMQLGMMGQEGTERRVDIIGARQTIDTLSLLRDKTKGNLTADEETIFETMLYQLRMAYVEMTNAVSRAAQAPKGPGLTKK